jgi:hypothetical protein
MKARSRAACWLARNERTSTRGRATKDHSKAANAYTNGKIKRKYKTSMKAYNTVKTMRTSTGLHYRHKTSNISPVYMFRRMNEAFLDKERVYDFPFGLIKIGGGK